MVTNPVTRHPDVTAGAISTLFEHAVGGVFLGIGTGDTGVRNLGERPATLRLLKNYVTCVRELLRRGQSTWRGNRVFLGLSSVKEVPIYIAAHGIGSLRMAAAIADGIFVGLGFSQEAIDGAERVIASSCDATRRDRGSLDLRWNVAGISINDNSQAAQAQIGWLVASFAHHFTRDGAMSSLVPEALQNAVAKLGEVYELTTHGRHSEEQKSLFFNTARELGVWEYLKDRFLLAGTRTEVIERLEELNRRGVRRIQISTRVLGLEGVAEILDIARAINTNSQFRSSAGEF